MRSLFCHNITIWFCIFFGTLSPLFCSTAQAKEIGIIIVSIYGVETAEREWKPMIDYLNEAIPEHSISLIPILPKDLDTIKETIRTEQANFIISQPAIYVDLELSLGVSRILTRVDSTGLSEFGSVLLVRADSPYQHISDLQGKTLAGVGPMGFGGWLVGVKEMLDRGFDPYTQSKEILYLGSQRKEVQAVLDGTVDLAVIRTGTLEKLAEEGKIELQDFRVLHEQSQDKFPLLHSSQLYPEWSFSKTKNTSDALAKSIALHLLELEANHPINRAAGFQEWVSPYSYRPVHDLLRELRVGPYKDYGKISYAAFFQQHVIEISFALIAIFSSVILVQVRTNRQLTAETRQKEQALHEKDSALEKLEHIAHHDSLTGLANRHLSLIILDQMIHRSIRHKETLVVCFVDLDMFKSINDSLGHDIGDDVLRQVATILTKTLRKVDVIGRIGGDEFLIVAEEVSNVPKFKERLEFIISEIQEIGRRLDLELPFGASIGAIYGVPHNYTSAELIKLSDELMYTAKRSGRGNVFLEPIPTHDIHVEPLFGHTTY